MKFLLKIGLPLAVIGGVAAWLYFAVTNRQININGWFVGGMVRGVDVSSYQTDVDFKELMRQEIKFAYIKATEGAGHVDASFAEKWAAVREAGLSAGAYHYFVYGESGLKQAENFVATLGDLESGDLIPAVDLELTMAEVKEPPAVEDVVFELKTFLAMVERRYSVKPILYSREDYYKKYLAKDFADYPRWVTNVFYPVYLESGDGWTVWQYNDCGVLTGYGGEKCIDLNAVNNKFGLDALKIK